MNELSLNFIQLTTTFTCLSCIAQLLPQCRLRSEENHGWQMLHITQEKKPTWSNCSGAKYHNRATYASVGTSRNLAKADSTCFAQFNSHKDLNIPA